MTIQSIKIGKFTEEKVDKNNTTEGSDSYDSSSCVVKKKIGFVVTNTNNEIFVIDKWLTIVDGKSDDDYSKDAYDAAKTEITAWDNSFANVGKTFNPDTGKME